MSDGTLIALSGIFLSLLVMLPFARAQRRRERASSAAAQRAHDYGLHEPVTMHPMIDPMRCICTSNCVAVCPEEVIGIRDGRAVAIAAGSCIGHGLCERSCPMDAIQLVYGTEKRGVELPRLRENFETNVPGLHIVGELGGMGLIGNAFEQGSQCVRWIARHKSRHDADFDIVIVGCGPAGLSAALHAREHGLRYLALEREDVGGTVRHYPRNKVVMTRPVKVPGFGKLDFQEISKEELISLWEQIVERTSLEVETGRRVERVERRTPESFVIATDVAEWSAHKVVLAIGRRGIPRKLGVPGEAATHVAYALREPEIFRDQSIVIVGGGDSAVEAALALSAQPGNRVVISYRGAAFSRIKEKNRSALTAAISEGVVKVIYESQVTEILHDHVRLATVNGRLTIPAERVFVFAGGELPSRFLKQCGIEIDVKFGSP